MLTFVKFIIAGYTVTWFSISLFPNFYVSPIKVCLVGTEDSFLKKTTPKQKNLEKALLSFEIQDLLKQWYFMFEYTPNWDRRNRVTITDMAHYFGFVKKLLRNPYICELYCQRSITVHYFVLKVKYSYYQIGIFFISCTFINKRTVTTRVSIKFWD